MNTTLVTRTATVLGTTAVAASFSFALAGPASAQRAPMPPGGPAPAPASNHASNAPAPDSQGFPWTEAALVGGSVIALGGVGYAGRVTLRRRHVRPA